MLRDGDVNVYVYLHTNGSLIRKPRSIGDPLEYFESDFIVSWWSLNGKSDIIGMLSDIRSRALYIKNPEYLIRIEEMYSITKADLFQHAVKIAAKEAS